MTRSAGSNRGRGRGSFIDSVLDGIDDFYSVVLGNLRAWSAAPPKLRERQPAPEDLDATVPSALQSTDYSSQDDPTFDSSDETAPRTDLPGGIAADDDLGDVPRDDVVAPRADHESEWLKN
jgi:hypothetical protein